MDSDKVRQLVSDLQATLIELEKASTRADTEGELSGSWVRSLIRARSLRRAHFEGTLFADPAWDMMLDLLLARLENRPVSVSSLCLAAGIPPTTALRLIGILVKQGIFVRRNDKVDGRRVFISLSEVGAMRLHACLSDQYAASAACV